MDISQHLPFSSGPGDPANTNPYWLAADIRLEYSVIGCKAGNSFNLRYSLKPSVDNSTGFGGG